jgi:hypothetical protein
VRLGILFWFYRDVVVCQNRLRLLRHRNPGVPIYGIYGGPGRDEQHFRVELAPRLDDFWAFPDDRDEIYKWRHGDVMLSRWFTGRGASLEWDSVFLAQWDLVVVAPVRTLLPPMGVGDMLISGVRPVREVEAWWQWTRGDARIEYEAFLAHVTARFGPVHDPMCCQFIGIVAPRTFMESYAGIDEPELGFLEYKIPIYAQAFGVPLVPDTCFRPWWPEEPATSHATRTQTLVHAWRTPVRLPVMLYESKVPHGRRIFHPYHGIYPHDAASLGELVRHRRRG